MNQEVLGIISVISQARGIRKVHPPTLLRKVDNCFGRFDGVSYDMSGLSPVQAFAKLSAVKMLTTARVGDEEEDLTMAEARSRLSEINNLTKV